MKGPAAGPEIPFLTELLGGELAYGQILLVKFRPNSIWYEAALTVTAQALRAGARTDFHTFTHRADDAVRGLEAQGVEVTRALREGRLRLLDSYTVQTGLETPPVAEPFGFASQSLRMADWKTSTPSVLGQAAAQRLVHIDENDSVLTDYNSEAEVLDFFRTRGFEGARRNEILFVHALVVGVHSTQFYATLEALVDVVVEFEGSDEQGALVQRARVVRARGRQVDTRWRPLRLLGHGEVAFAAERPGRSPPSVAHSAAGPQRLLAAVMFVDMVGFTASVQSNEEEALRLLEECRALVRPLVAQHDGLEVKTMGDGFLLEFASALSATRCAVAVQEALERRNAAAPSAPLTVRIGLHVGDVVHRDGDVYGDAVNIASRIEALAPPGGILLSQPVYDQVWNKLDRPIVRLGAVELKNVRQEVTLYRVERPSPGATPGPSARS